MKEEIYKEYGMRKTFSKERGDLQSKISNFKGMSDAEYRVSTRLIDERAALKRDLLIVLNRHELLNKISMEKL